MVINMFTCIIRAYFFFSCFVSELAQDVIADEFFQAGLVSFNVSKLVWIEWISRGSHFTSET